MYQKIVPIKTIQSSPLIELIKEYNELYENIIKLNNYIKKVDKIINIKNGALVCDNAALSEIEVIYEQSRTIEDEEYKDALTLKEKYLELGKKGELKRNELLHNIEHLLKRGENPNHPETISKRDYPVGGINVKIYPLHMAMDSNLTTLLLKYGADQNIKGYVASSPNDHYTTSYLSIWDDITALEAACFRYNYDKVEILLSSSCKIDIEQIEKSLVIVLNHIDECYASYYRPHGLYRMVEIMRNEAMELSKLEVIQKLSEKSSEQFLTKLLKPELEHEKRALGIINLIPEKNRAWRKELDWYKLIGNKIDIYTNCLSQKLILPIWLVLSMGQSQEGNELNSLPNEILKLITFHLFQLELWKVTFTKIIAINKLAEVNTLKVDVFKKIYQILVKYDSTNEFPKLSNLNEKTYIEIISLVEQESEKDGCSLIIKAWELTLMHYNDFSSQNDFLVQALAMWAAKNNPRYNVLLASSYKLTIFESTCEKQFIFIKEAVINDINVLTKISGADMDMVHTVFRVT